MHHHVAVVHHHPDAVAEPLDSARPSRPAFRGAFCSTPPRWPLPESCESALQTTKAGAYRPVEPAQVERQERLPFLSCIALTIVSINSFINRIASFQVGKDSKKLTNRKPGRIRTLPFAPERNGTETANRESPRGGSFSKYPAKHDGRDGMRPESIL